MCEKCVCVRKYFLLVTVKLLITSFFSLFGCTLFYRQMNIYSKKLMMISNNAHKKIENRKYNE